VGGRKHLVAGLVGPGCLESADAPPNLVNSPLSTTLAAANWHRQTPKTHAPQLPPKSVPLHSLKSQFNEAEENNPQSSPPWPLYILSLLPLPLPSASRRLFV